MLKLNYITSVESANDVFPKVYAKTGGTYELINTMPSEFEGYLLELPEGEEWPEGKNLYKVTTEEGMSLLSITIGGGTAPDVAWVTSHGREYGKSTWIDYPIPEPTHEVNPDSYMWGHAHTYGLTQDTPTIRPGDRPIERGDFVIFPGTGIRLNLETMEQAYSEVLEHVPGGPFSPSVATTYQVTHDGTGNYAYAGITRYGGGGAS